ncbi:MAG: UDP-N-acetylmuramate--L-alanine ligase [Acidimicrobiales bacterium]
MADGSLDLTRTGRIHVANVGGAGMSAIATLLLEMGHPVSGHDPADDTPFLARLRTLGADITTGAPGPLPDTDAVVVSTATPADHPHVQTARRAGLPVVHRSAALAAICRGRTTVAVAGTHGKTTTSALLATLLSDAGVDPGFIVGAEVAGLGRSAVWGGPGPLVVEADESDGTFLALGATTAIVTNLEADHLEHWGGEPALRAAFARFVADLPGPAVLCADDPGSLALAVHAAEPITYGTAASADYRITDVATEGTAVRFTLTHAGDAVAVTVAEAPGVHNARNAAAAIGMAHRLGVDLAVAARALGSFRGVARRFEVRGEAAGVVLVDSYDHLPTEGAAALAAARAGDWARVVCCFQPHRYSRTEALGRSFADSFADADLLVVTGIYPAGEVPRPGVTGKIVADAVLDAHPWKRVAWLPTLDDVVTYLGNTLRAGDLCLTLGAGDLTTVPPRVLERLSTSPDRRGR